MNRLIDRSSPLTSAAFSRSAKDDQPAANCDETEMMVELLRTDDPVLLSLLMLRLREAGIEPVVFDTHTALAYGGAIGQLQSRLMIAEADLPAGEQILVAVRSLAGQPPAGDGAHG